MALPLYLDLAEFDSLNPDMNFRIGICYLQQSQCVRDYRHSDILVPRAYTKTPELLERYKRWVYLDATTINDSEAEIKAIEALLNSK